MRAGSTPVAALAAMVLIWGYSWVVMKIALRHAQPFDFAHIRPARVGTDERAQEQHDDERRERNDRIREELHHAHSPSNAGTRRPEERRRAVRENGD